MNYMMYVSGIFDIFGDQNTIKDMETFREKITRMGAHIYHQRGKKGIRIHYNGNIMPCKIIDFAQAWAHSHKLDYAYGAFSLEDIADPEPTH